ncbi:hypothetical protein PHYPSEUDO_006902 [Phytophthora pseudosyringae]|uniref:Uncharacterized protein n=1 Tax=Phytophthora pseudosyringae TaxID=221518 RepID=A0A8T1VKM2_9STRA|nr:hypothetical protein PHYPSEUDO_006902 [Phytophthora pseudosyringae]
MERLGGGLKKGGKGIGRAAASATADRGSATPAKGKFKLRTSKDPLPLLTKKQPSRETKPKAKVLTSVRGTKPSVFAANSFMRPLSMDGAPKKSTGFSFMKFQPKAGELAASSGKTAPPPLASTKPLLAKFSGISLTKKQSNPTTESGARTDKQSLFKPAAKRALPPAFRAETKSSAAKKRKAIEAFTHDKKNAFPTTPGRVKPSFMLKNPPLRKEKDNANFTGSSVSFGSTMSGMKVKANDEAVFKKRSFLATSAVAVPAPKMTQIVQELGDVATGVVKSGSSSGDACNSNENFGLSTLTVFKRARTSPDFDDDAVKSVQSSAAPPSPDCREDCLNGIEEELAMKLLCTVDDDTEDEFHTRVTAIQEFTDRVGHEQKQLRNRLLDAHADVSESLLDGLTDLMAEEGGIGIDKLDFDMNIDVNVGDAFLQVDEIHVIQ